MALPYDALTAALDACARVGDYAAAEALLTQMVEDRCEPNLRTYRAVARAAAAAGAWDAADAALDDVRDACRAAKGARGRFSPGPGKAAPPPASSSSSSMTIAFDGAPSAVVVGASSAPSLCKPSTFVGASRSVGDSLALPQTSQQSHSSTSLITVQTVHAQGIARAPPL